MSLNYPSNKLSQPIIDTLIENKEKLLFISAVYGQDLTIEEIAGAKAIIYDICFTLDTLLNTMTN